MSQCKCYAAGEPEIREQCLHASMLLYLDSWHFSVDQFSFEKSWDLTFHSMLQISSVVQN